MLLCWTAAAVAIAKILFYYRQHPFPDTRLLGSGLLKLVFRPSSMYGIVVIACTYFVLHQRAVKTKLLYLGPLLASFSYVLLAQSRSTLLSLVVVMIALQLSMWLLHKEDRRNYTNRLLIVMVLIFAASAVFLRVYPEYFKLAFLRKISYQVRLDIWGHLLVRIKNAPWFGHSLIADPRTEVIGVVWLHPHSVYVATLLYGGIVGLLLLMAVVISGLWQGFGRARQSINLVAACMVLYGALCIVPNGNMLIHHPKPFWLFFWFPLALVVASELPGHPLHGEFEIPKGGGTASAAVE
jgi:O-antigen ligase